MTTYVRKPFLVDAVEITEENIAELASFVGTLQTKDDGTIYIQVSVNFKNRPPRVIMITSASRNQLAEESVSVLDWAEIRVADLIARGYDWTVNGKSGTKAYLQSLFVTIEEDELERKYAVNEPDHQ